MQLYVEVPTQYRLLYLAAFLYAHQGEKVILFASNCELVNFLHSLLTTLDWGLLGDKEPIDQVREERELLFGGRVFKLHGNLEHAARKQNFFGFDSKASALLICTDVASRGLDFKAVDWVLQYEPASQIKEYANRIGRTARMASKGQSLVFLMPQELKYVEHMNQ
mmetsp:Transcript_27331/g.20468  ORF Transcript_27331/g.20468 Transcript_27331/m.20468 type:complete len:165 (+) Transcript_27331:703-1197(+)